MQILSRMEIPFPMLGLKGRNLTISYRIRHLDGNGKNEKRIAEDEAKRGFAGHFGAGLPAASDGQMLF